MTEETNEELEWTHERSMISLAPLSYICRSVNTALFATWWPSSGLCWTWISEGIIPWPETNRYEELEWTYERSVTSSAPLSYIWRSVHTALFATWWPSSGLCRTWISEGTIPRPIAIRNYSRMHTCKIKDTVRCMFQSASHELHSAKRNQRS